MTNDNVLGPMMEMPKYQCHKKVWALKIANLVSYADTDGGVWCYPADEGYARFVLDRAFMEKHKPVDGGYYVVYDDGYKSFSPAKAFEDGYTRI